MSDKIKCNFNYSPQQTSRPSIINNDTMLGRAILIFPKSYLHEALHKACLNSPHGMLSIKVPYKTIDPWGTRSADDWVVTGQFGSIGHFGGAVKWFIEQGLTPISMTYIPKLNELEVSSDASAE